MKCRKYIIPLLAAVLYSQIVCAQTGPAGVGSPASNIIWLKADAGTSTTTSGSGVSQWNDQSGNGNNVSQATGNRQPLYRSSMSAALNGMPAMEFDNDATNYDYMTCPDNATLDNYTSMTAFSVFRHNTGTPAGTPRAIFSKRLDPSSNNCFGWFHYTSNFFYLDVNGTANRMNTSAAYTTGTDYLIGFAFNGALSGNEQKMYNGNTLNVQGNNSSANVPNYASDFHVGVLFGHTGSNKQFNGYIPEIIVYNVELNPAQRFIINNYLSAKYDIALASDDYYSGDTPGNGNFDREVCGIGQFSTGNTNNAFSSSVCGGMGITHNSGFNDGDYVLAGHNLAINANINSDMAVVSGGPLQARWQRVWYIDVTNTSTAMSTNITFDLSDGGFSALAGIASNYKLLYRSTNSGNWTIVATASFVSLDQITFANFSFTGNAQDGYYTIGTLNASNGTLPLVWLDFEVQADDSDALLSWSTATEFNTSFFAIERMDGNGFFHDIGTVPSAGNSVFVQHYSFTDAGLDAGTYYYRLRSTDQDGSVSYSSIQPVVIGADYNGYKAYPNPSAGSITIEISDAWLEQRPVLRIADSKGQIVRELSVTTWRTLIELPAGLYTMWLSGSGITSAAQRVVITGQ